MRTILKHGSASSRKPEAHNRVIFDSRVEIGALLAAIFGLIDWIALPSGTRAKRIGLWHGGGNVVIVVLFIVSWLIRLNAQSNPNVVAYILSAVGVALALLTGWLGGELVDRLGVGVDEGANVNAPSSLSGEPATVTASSTTEERRRMVG